MKVRKLKQLGALPHFKIEKIVPDEFGHLQLAGAFNHLFGVREGRSWLYAPPPSIIGDLVELIPEHKSAVFIASVWDFTPKIKEGMIFPWIDGYWNAKLIERILETKKSWVRTKFESSDALAFDQDGVRGLGKATLPIPPKSKSLGLVHKGWDHEHCEICRNTIGTNGLEFGYTDPENFWLCPDCYEKYGASHDLSFMDAS
jgi:hypothetical protein